MITVTDFATEIHQYDKILRPFASNLTKSREEMEDLVQDTFYRAIANRDKFIEGTNVKAWLFTIMKNIFINNYRKNQKRGTVVDTTDNAVLINNPKRSVKNDGELQFVHEEIQRAIEGVSKDFTEPFLMYYRGFKYQEISETLNLPLGTVKSRIFFARKELQNRLKTAGITHSAI